MHYYLQVLKHYATFDGRAGRKEFWVFTLISLAIALMAAFIDRKLGICFKMEIGYGLQTLPYGYCYLFYGLSTLVPTIALHIRRLHDVGKSGWFAFIVLIPVIGAIYLLVLYCTAGSPGSNVYGPPPAQQ